MLSSTADNLYWMARCLERAENTACMLDVGYSTSLLNPAPQVSLYEWSTILSTSDLHCEFAQRYPEINANNVLHFMVLDETNPFSVSSSVKAARENGRAERGSITSEMWESVNFTWLEMREKFEAGRAADGVSTFFEWFRERMNLLRGLTYGTMLRGDVFNFMRLGSLLERAINTANVLDIRYHTRLRMAQDVGSVTDYYQWSPLLRSVASFEFYRKVYRDVVTPKHVAELLILNAEAPRSLYAIMQELKSVVFDLSGLSGVELRRCVNEFHSELLHGHIDVIMAQGLHEYLAGLLTRLNTMGNAVSQTYICSLNSFHGDLHEVRTSIGVLLLAKTGAGSRLVAWAK